MINGTLVDVFVKWFKPTNQARSQDLKSDEAECRQLLFLRHSHGARGIRGHASLKMLLKSEMPDEGTASSASC